jgi:hypothetical protein
VDVAEGVTKPRARHAARPGGCAIMRVRRSGKCRRARKPRGGSIVRRVDLRVPGRCGCAAMGLCREAQAQGGPLPEQSGGRSRSAGARRALKRRAGGAEPVAARSDRICVPEAQRNPMRGPAGPREGVGRVAGRLTPPEGRDGEWLYFKNVE